MMDDVDVNIDVSVFVVGYVVGIFTYTDVVKTTTEATEISLFYNIHISYIVILLFTNSSNCKGEQKNEERFQIDVA